MTIIFVLGLSCADFIFASRHGSGALGLKLQWPKRRSRGPDKLCLGGLPYKSVRGTQCSFLVSLRIFSFKKSIVLASAVSFGGIIKVEIYDSLCLPGAQESVGNRTDLIAAI